MRLTNDVWMGARRLATLCLIAFGLMIVANGQAVTTTTVQGTVYLANGQPGGGTLAVSWPAFTTASGQLVAADRTTVTIGNDGFVSINLAPNQGATPAGQYYTAVFYMSDGSVSTQYWLVPSAAQATLAQIQAQVMPAAQAVQAVSKAYVDQQISELTGSLLTASGGTLSGPLYLNGDPSQPLQAADKHYVDSQVANTVSLAGGNMYGPLTTPDLNGVEAPEGPEQTTLQATINAAGLNGAMQIPPTYAGTDTFTNPNGVRVMDMRTAGAQQVERSVREFGAECDGMTDDTNALQTAINYAQLHGVALTIPQGTCKTHTLSWHGESIGGLGKQVSALMGFPGQDVLATSPDNPNVLSYTRLHDLTIYVDQSQDVSCSPAEGRAAAGSCLLNRPMESNTIFSPGGNGLNGTAGSGAGWSAGNCAIAMQATTGTGGNGLKNAQIENLEIAATGTDPMAAQYPGSHSTHTCGLYLAQWPQWSEFKNIDIRGLNTGIAIPALPVTKPAGLIADSNRWQNITITATHGFTAAAGCNGILDDVTMMAGNSAATGEPPTGIVLDLPSGQEGWTVRNAVVIPNWTAVQPAVTVTASSGAVTAVTVGAEHGLGWDPYGTTVPVAFSGSCTAQANATVNSNGSIGAINITQGGVGCSSTTTASINAPGTWDTAAPVNLIGGQNMTFFAGSLLRGNGGYTVWNATGAQSYGTQVNGGGGNLPGGGSYPAFVANNSIGSTLQVDQFSGIDFGGKLQACVSAVNANYGGTCDARNFTGNQTMSANLTISTPNTTVLLPCATISAANQVIVTAGTRNVALRGCAMRGGTAASGSQGGTAFAFSGTGAAIQVGDPTYAVDTPGFHMDNSVMNTTGSGSATAQGLIAYRTQEIDLEDMYFLGNSNQTGITLDGTGNYTGGTIRSVQVSGFQTAVNAIGHQAANPATTDWMNASTFVRLHIDCPTSNGSPIAGTYGINLQQGDGNTFTGGDVEGCSTALHLGVNAQNNTIIGLRNENSTSQVVADAGSSYNNWITGGTMFTGKLTDNGTRNSFQDTFHRTFNGVNGDWYGSQIDATVTNHYSLGIGLGNVRGIQEEYQTDVPGSPGSYHYTWIWGPGDGASGQQLWSLNDVLDSVQRFGVQQNTAGGGSAQSFLNGAGTGNVCFNCSNNSGTGGVAFGSGGASNTTVATINNAGNAQFNGTLLVGGASQSTGTLTVRNSADAEVDYYLWPGLTASQKGSFTYKDWNGNSQWYLVKDSSNNWAVNSAIGGLDSIKAYQSTNSGDTYINASNSTGHIRLNYETGSGAETDVYSGSNANLVASFLGPTAIKFPGLAAGTGHYCMQIDNSGYITNTGTACGTGSGSGSGTVNSGNSGQIAYYTSNGTTVGGINAVPLTSGGTGATSASAAMANLLPGVAADGNQGVTITGNVAANSMTAANATSTSPAAEVATFNNLHNATWVSVAEYGAIGNCTAGASNSSCTDNSTAIQSAINHCFTVGCAVFFPANPAATAATVYYVAQAINWKGVSLFGPTGARGQINGPLVAVRGAAGKDVFAIGDPTILGSSYVQPLKQYTVRDLGIIVDDSLDASSSGTRSYPNRLPGRTVYDAAMTSGSAVLTSITALFQPGDVGQAVTVSGAGSSGNLTTAISSYQSATQVTLAVPASTTVSNVQTYVSVMNLSATQTLGNCAFAYDASAYSGVEAAIGANSEDFTNVNVLTTDNLNANNTCGFFFQGAAGTYQGRWEHDTVRIMFGFAFVPSDLIAPNSQGQCDGICDFNVIDQTWITSNYPFVAYGGNDNTIRDVQLSNTMVGPNILAFTGPSPWPWQWHIDIPEEENPANSCNPSMMAYRIAGRNFHVDRLGSPQCTSGNELFQWDASFSTVDELDMTALGPINITGYMNSITVPYPQPGYIQPTVTGLGNQFITCGSSNPFKILASSCQFVGQNTATATIGVPQLSRGRTVFNRTHDFINRGASSYYFNDEDLWIWPGEGEPYTLTIPFVFDSTSVTGAAFQLAQCAGSCTAYNLYESNGTGWVIGQQVPAGPARIYFSAEAASAGTTLSVSSGYGTLGSSPLTALNCSKTLTLTTSYATYWCDVDMTGLAGNGFGIKLGGNIEASNVNVAWIAVKPWNTEMETESLTIGTPATPGTPITGSIGNGGYVQQTTNGTKTPNDLVCYDSNGNDVDCGASVSNIGTPTVNTNPGDLICAHAGDTTIHAIAITGGSCNGATCSINGSSIPNDYLAPGQLVGIAGSGGVTGLNSGPYALSSGSSTSIAFPFTTASGTPSGGTFYRWCENTSDALTYTLGTFAKNTVTVGAGTLQLNHSYVHKAQFNFFSTATAEGLAEGMEYGSPSVYQTTAESVSASLTGNSGQLTVDMTPLVLSSTGPLETTLEALTLPSSTFPSPVNQTSNQPASVSTIAAASVQVWVKYTATGLGSITSGNGGTISGTGTCTLTISNGGGSGATATVTISGGVWSGATFAVNSTGYGYTSAPTSATLGNGTATCSGTATLVTVLGGATGNAVDLVSLQ